MGAWIAQFLENLIRTKAWVLLVVVVVAVVVGWVVLENRNTKR